MTHQPVKSSNVRTVAYDAGTRQMEVTFHSGLRYRYHDVPASDHAALMAAPSIGGHFIQHVRDKFRTEKVS